ncbi:MAG: hypothetical protein E7441_02630 [Ruminococcaceae bacterium]|nr:hypothetical protein [Oscillospiraceae bacterium]
MKRLLSVLLCICMVMTLIPAVGAASEPAYPDYIKICNIQLNDGDYLASNSATAASNNWTPGDAYVALYKDGVLKLNNINIVNNEGGTSSGDEDHAIYWSLNYPGGYNLVIELVEGTTNTIVDKKWSAINGADGWGSEGPSVTIQGKGTLNITGGSYGIWVWRDIIISKGATVNVIGESQSGICNNTSAGSIIIKQGTDVTVTGGKYGVESDNNAVGKFVVMGGELTVKGNDAVGNEVTEDFGGNTVYVSSNVSGEGLTEWDGTSELKNYKYLSLSGFSDSITTYSVNKASVNNGSVAVDFEKSMADETVTITATPAAGYETESITVTDADSGNVTVVGSENIRTFTMPAKNVTVSATFKQAGGEEPVAIEDVEFTHAYDAQRSPRFPAKDDPITLRDLDFPLDADGEHMQTNEGEWTLTNAGAYYFMKDTASDYLKQIIEGVAGNYTGINTDEIIIHELKDDDTHIAYGVVVAFDAEEQRAFYLGDTWSNGAGYLLAMGVQGDSTTMTATMVPTDFIDTAEYKIEIDRGGTYTFAEASSGYEAQTPVTVTVSNKGTAATGELTVSLSGEDAESFVLSATTIDNIEVNGEATFTVVPKEDLAVTTHTATVSVGSGTIIPKSFNVSFSVIAGEEGEEGEQPSGNRHYGGLQAGGDTSRTGADNLGSQYKDEDEPETETKPVVKPDDGVCDGTSADNCPAANFADLNTSAWYHADVDYAITKGLFNGTSGTAFSPNGKLTRAMLVAVLYRAEGSPATNKSIPFADVDMGAYYANAVSWAQQNRIVTGVSETNFAPDEYITREQIATILFRYASYKGRNVDVNDEALSFADAASVSDYALAAMTWNIKNGFVQGRSGNMLAPRESATRAEAAALLHRFLEAK